MPRVTIILNPASGRGALAALHGRIKSAFDRFHPRFEITSEPRDEERLARAAAERGAETIVAVGGDGTWGNVAHGIVTSGRSPRLAIIAAGTGNDFAKSTAAPAADPDATARLIASGAEHRMDVGLAGDRVFLNCCGTGFDTAVLARSARMPLVGGAVRYLAAALAELRSYRGENVRIAPWPAPAACETLLTVFANGAWYGGMFHIAPDAVPDDGRLEAIRIADVRGYRRLRLLGAALRGRHIGSRDVQLSSGNMFSLEFERPPLVNTDGEVRLATGTLLEIRTLHRALRLVAPAAD